MLRTSNSDHLSNDAYIEAIWPSIADANSRAEAFSQIMREIIAVLPSSTMYPQTDKGNIIRAQACVKFADIINQLYSIMEEGTKDSLKLSIPKLEDFIISAFRDNYGVSIPSPSYDFFTAGIDSLRAIQMRRILQRSVDICGKTLPPNVIYKQGSVKKIASYLYFLRISKAIGNSGHDITDMRSLIKKYSNFQQSVVSVNPTISVS